MRWNIAQRFEKAWWKQYLRNKPIDEYLVWKRQYWTNFLQSYCPDFTELGNEQILDAGCGPAGVFIVLNQRNVTAIDPLLDTYKKDIPHFTPTNYPNVRFVQSTIEQFQHDIQFDTIFCLNAINHVSDIQLAIKNLYNVLSKNGTAYISVDAHNYQILRTLFGWLPGDILHPHQYNIHEYTDMMQAIGFTIKTTTLIHRESIFSYYLISAVKL